MEPAVKQHTQKQLGSAPFIQLLLREGQLIMCPRSDYTAVGVLRNRKGRAGHFAMVISLEVVLSLPQAGMFMKPHPRHTWKGQMSLPDTSRQLP